MDYTHYFIEFILPLKDCLYRYALNFLNNRQEAEDVIQEVMIRLWNKRESWNNLSNVQAYALSITRNLCIDERRKNHAKSSDIIDLKNLELREDNPEQQINAKELQNTIHYAFMNLSEKQQICFHLRENEGKTYEEIAALSGISLDQVKINIFRARSFIRKVILKEEKWNTLS